LIMTVPHISIGIGVTIGDTYRQEQRGCFKRSRKSRLLFYANINTIL
jgi:hypothetical protein